MNSRRWWTIRPPVSMPLADTIIIGRGAAGPLNAITDVDGVRVGHAVPSDIGERGDEAVALARDRGDEARVPEVVVELDAHAPDVAIDFARIWQATDKIVYSRTLDAPTTARTR